MRDRALVLYTSAVMAILVASHAYSEEGLFKPEGIALPPAVEQSIPAVVRVYSRLFFDVHVCNEHTFAGDL